MKEFERHYSERMPMYWYTCGCFLYRMLHHALQLMDGDIVIRVSICINDVHRRIEKFHQEHQDKNTMAQVLTVYRDQGSS